MGKKSQTAEQTAESKAAKEKAAQLAEQHKLEQEAADKAFRAEQGGRAVRIGQALLAESTGGMVAAYAVGVECWEYVDAEVTRAGANGKAERFTSAVKQLQADLSARMTAEVTPNISRYLGYVGLAKLWGEDKVKQLPRSFAQNALPLITRDDTAPGLTWTEDTTHGKESRFAYSWVPGCEVKGPELMDKAIAGLGTCQAMTLDGFVTARAAFHKGGKGRHNQKGTNKGGKGKGGKALAAGKSAAKLAECIKAIKAYATISQIPAATRLKGLAAAVATIRELRDAIKAAAVKGKADKAEPQAVAA